jgi:hypothetical protein
MAYLNDATSTRSTPATMNAPNSANSASSTRDHGSGAVCSNPSAGVRVGVELDLDACITPPICAFQRRRCSSDPPKAGSDSGEKPWPQYSAPGGCRAVQNRTRSRTSSLGFGEGLNPRDYRFLVRFAARALRHLRSSFSRDDFGMAMMRLVRFASRSIGVLPGAVIFIVACSRKTTVQGCGGTGLLRSSDLRLVAEKGTRYYRPS